MNERTRAVAIGSTSIGGDSGFALIAGPCVIESERHARFMAEALAKLASDLKIPFIFKSSYDKANRSSIGGYRGPGIVEGLRILAAIKKDLQAPIISDVHCREDMDRAAEVLDIIQIPAFLSRQTDFLVAAAKTNKPVNIKKGQFLAPWDMKNAVEKVVSAGNDNVVITERGVSFGYNNLVADMRALAIMRKFGYPVIFDATHSVQLPGGQGTCSGGDREMAQVLARAATAAGVDGVFLEVHDEPDKALCDGPNMIPLAEMPELMRTLLAIDAIVHKT